MNKFFVLKDNHLIIVDDKGEFLEDATENTNECAYCIHKPKDCDASAETKGYGGQFCDSMMCKLKESDEE